MWTGWLADREVNSANDNKAYVSDVSEADYRHECKDDDENDVVTERPDTATITTIITSSSPAAAAAAAAI